MPRSSGSTYSAGTGMLAASASSSTMFRQRCSSALSLWRRILRPPMDSATVLPPEASFSQRSSETSATVAATARPTVAKRSQDISSR